MSDDLDKLLHSALHGILPLKRRESLLRRYGGWIAVTPDIVFVIAFLVLFIGLSIVCDFIEFWSGRSTGLICKVLFGILVLVSVR